MTNYKHLQYFQAVAKTGSVNRAAEKLHLTPQTLSGQIKTFVARLGVALFQRSGRRLELTHAGRLALCYADEIFQIGTELQEALSAPASARTMPFRVGISDAVPKAIANQLLMPAFGLEEPVQADLQGRPPRAPDRRTRHPPPRHGAGGQTHAHEQRSQGLQPSAWRM